MSYRIPLPVLPGRSFPPRPAGSSIHVDTGPQGSDIRSARQPPPEAQLRQVRPFLRLDAAGCPPGRPVTSGEPRSWRTRASKGCRDQRVKNRRTPRWRRRSAAPPRYRASSTRRRYKAGSRSVLFQSLRTACYRRRPRTRGHPIEPAQPGRYYRSSQPYTGASDHRAPASTCGRLPRSVPRRLPGFPVLRQNAAASARPKPSRSDSRRPPDTLLYPPRSRCRKTSLYSNRRGRLRRLVRARSPRPHKPQRSAATEQRSCCPLTRPQAQPRRKTRRGGSSGSSGKSRSVRCTLTMLAMAAFSRSSSAASS